MENACGEESASSLLSSKYPDQQTVSPVVQLRVSSVGVVRSLILIILGLRCYRTWIRV
ncbi:MAG: hypothetical protein MUC48_27255 [Leptolyngbya sp. Prado105]|nr:hypothetical protein [Leptolyngbya sp. Prado105]